MNQERLVDRYEPLDSILQLYKRFGKSSNLVKHILRFIEENIRVKQQDRRHLLSCMFNHQQNRNKKVRNFIVSIASDLDVENQQILIEQLIIKTKTKINELDDRKSRITNANQLNSKIYQQVNILKAYRDFPEDFQPLFQLWEHWY